jgi:DNA gyrase inhibitor GyrI
MLTKLIRYTGLLALMTLMAFPCLRAQDASQNMEETMLAVEIVKLKAMYAATFYGFGENPEQTAWDKLIVWAKPRGLLDDPKTHPIYGYNNPPPSEGNTKYGYVLWIKADPETEPEGDMRVELFYGGVYAVTKCTLDNIHQTWMDLYKWAEEHGYKHAYAPGLEKTVSSIENMTEPSTFMMELYLPIADKP